MSDTLHETEVEDKNQLFLMQAKGIYHIYRGRDQRSSVVALKAISLNIDYNDFVAVVGPSGSGKSSLMKILGGIMRPTAGHVHYEGYDITKSTEDDLTLLRRRMVGFVFQEGNLMPYLSALANIQQSMAFNGWPYEARKKRALELLDIVGVLNRKNQLAFRLSGGERQRVAIARALANSPKLIIADEPTGNVDYRNSIHLLELFKELNRDIGTSFLLASHSNTVASYANRSIELRDGLFAGQHTGDIDLSQLDMSRIVIMDEDNRVAIPEHIRIGDQKLWSVDRKGDQIILTPFEAIARGEISIEAGSVIECPVCGAHNNSTVKICTSCGAKL